MDSNGHPKTVLSYGGSEDSLLDTSTAPTTPDGSVTLSPVLQAMELHDILEGTSRSSEQLGATTASLSADIRQKLGVKTICCVGAGYVGGPTAAVIAYQNPHIAVTVVDRDARRIAQWRTRHLPIFEPGLQDILRIARDGSKACKFQTHRGESVRGILSRSSQTSPCESRCNDHTDEIMVPARLPNLFFSTEVSRSISEADVIFIAVNTPTKQRGVGAGKATDLTALEAVSREIAIYAKPGAIIVEKSTVPCRTADIVQDTADSNPPKDHELKDFANTWSECVKLRIHRPTEHFEILSNPEFLAAGTAVNDLLKPDRVVIGSSPTPAGIAAAETLASVYAAWVPRSRIVTVNTWSSELAKLVANSMLAQRISSINSISAICEQIGADIEEVSRAVGLDPRIGAKYLKAGVGFGGSCFKKDILSLIYLAESLDLSEVADYWTQVLTLNEWQRTRFVRRVVRCLSGTLAGKKITVLGYAFKKDTDDTRESPALEVIKMLLHDEPREIAIFDPFCNPHFVEGEIAKLIGADVLMANEGSIGVYADAYQACSRANAVLILTDCDEFKNSPSSASSTLKVTQASKTAKHRSVDPRPFERLEPTESQIRSLQKYLSTELNKADPLQRLEDEPECVEGCAKCVHEMERTVVLEAKGNEQLDWLRIAYHLQKPKWVFDGRGLIDVSAMEALGLRVESIGKASSH